MYGPQVCAFVISFHYFVFLIRSISCSLLSYSNARAIPLTVVPDDIISPVAAGRECSRELTSAVVPAKYKSNWDYCSLRNLNSCLASVWGV